MATISDPPAQYRHHVPVWDAECSARGTMKDLIVAELLSFYIVVELCEFRRLGFWSPLQFAREFLW